MFKHNVVDREEAHKWTKDLTPKHLFERSKIVRTFEIDSRFPTSLASLIHFRYEVEDEKRRG